MIFGTSALHTSDNRNGHRLFEKQHRPLRSGTNYRPNWTWWNYGSELVPGLLDLWCSAFFQNQRWPFPVLVGSYRWRTKLESKGLPDTRPHFALVTSHIFLHADFTAASDHHCHDLLAEGVSNWRFNIAHDWACEGSNIWKRYVHQERRSKFSRFRVKRKQG